jgi:hypothetical protein
MYRAIRLPQLKAVRAKSRIVVSLISMSEIVGVGVVNGFDNNQGKEQSYNEELDCHFEEG